MLFDMSSERIRELLAELNRELQSTKEIDDETLELLGELSNDVEALAGETTSAAERAVELESRFAAEHPVAQRIAREIADLLSKMGI